MLFGVLSLVLASSTQVLGSGSSRWRSKDRRPHGGRNGGRIGMPGKGRWHGQGNNRDNSPEFPYLFSSELPIPDVAQPMFTETVNGVPIDYYEMTIESFDIQLFPDRGPTTLIGYNGTVPGPTFRVEEGRETVVRVLNHGNRTAAMHLHGMWTHAAWDGWANDEIEIGQYKDYYYPNNEGARSIWYHDHAEHTTATDSYYGQAGVYVVYDPKEDALGLPSGRYDVPLALSDKSYDDNGQLVSPEGEQINFVGDFIQVNEQPWPYLTVKPRKYRFRMYDMSISRPYDLYFTTDDGDWLTFDVIGSDSGLFGSPVRSDNLVISMGERYDIVVDFSSYAGQNITMGNQMQNPQVEEYDNTDKVMRFIVGDDAYDTANNGPVPETLNGDIAFPEQRTTVDQTFNFQMGGDDVWTINGVSFTDRNNRVLARPKQGTVELWELRHTGGPGVHPVHIHLVNMQIVSRSGGDRGLLPYETAGLKDTVFLTPGEVVHVLAYYGPWNGLYMFHCHNLVHEDHAMMAAFNVSLLNELGYDFESTQGYDDPEDPQFGAKDFRYDEYTDSAKHSAVRSLGSMNAYQPASSLIAAQSQYYADHGRGTSMALHSTKTAPAMSSGYGFMATTTSQAMEGYETVRSNRRNRNRNSSQDRSRGARDAEAHILDRDDKAELITPKWQTIAKMTAAPSLP